MRKKYLSALLFGALLFASATTFTSCKDYDDDIDNLQGQITANADAIKKLQDLVGAGKFVSAVSNTGNTINFTFTDGSTQAITLTDEKGSVVTINEDGYLCIDGKATEIKAAAPTEVHKDQIIIENGMWSTLQEDGTYKSTNIPVSGVNVSGSEADGYTFIVFDANGNKQEVKLPSAASAITSITLGTSATQVKVVSQEFNLNRTGNAITKAADWKGPKTLPVDGSYVYSLADELNIRINPTDVPAENVKFYLTNTKNEDLQPIVFEAVAQGQDDPLSDVDGRAAISNGLYGLKMATCVVEKDGVEAVNDAINAAKTNGYVYAINAGHATRSNYGLKVVNGTATTLSTYQLKQSETGTQTRSQAVGSTNTTATAEFKVGAPIEVLANNANALFDMFLEADPTDVSTFGLSFDQEKHTVTIGKNPDVSSLAAKFNLTVWTVDNTGVAKKSTINVNVSSEISANPIYDTHVHDVTSDNNFFGIDLAAMKTALGDNLNAWSQNVNLSNTEYKLYKEAECETVVSSAGLAPMIVKEVKKNNSTTTNRDDANFIQVDVTNASISGLTLNTVYYLKVTFKTGVTTPAPGATNVLNSIVVPVKFTAPAFSTAFVKESAVFKNGGNTAYAYLNVEDQAYNNTNTGFATYKFSRAFSAMPTNAVLTLDSETKVAGDNKSADVAAMGTAQNSAAISNVTLTDATKIYLTGTQDATTGLQPGYGKELIVKAVANNNKLNGTGWLYAEGDGEYTFKIVVLSPIYEGTITATNGVVTIPATATEGYKMGNADITGKTYNNITYKVLQDVVDSWSRKEINAVAAVSENTRVATIAEIKNAEAGANNTVNEGYILVKPENIAETTETTVKVTVTDIWGYKKVSDITVKVTVE